MKTTKDLLRETFYSIPDKFAYRDVKFHVYQAWQKLEKIEKHEHNKEKQQLENKAKEEKAKLQPWMPPIYQSQLKETLNIIDEMIAKENKLIESVQNKKGNKQQDEPKSDHDGLQTFHG